MKRLPVVSERGHPLRAAALLVLVLLGGPGGTSVAAQELERVEELVSAGEGERARQILTGWLESGLSPELLPWGIWLEGRLASDPDVAALHYGRVAVEFPGSDFADDALFRLAMLAEARGDWKEARERLGSLLRDYPGSPLRMEAGERLRRTPASQTPSAPVAGGGSADAGTPVPPWEARAAIEEALRQDLALRESQGFQEDEESLPPSVEEVEVAGGLPPASGRYTVQLGAFSTRERAEALAHQAQRVGLVPRVVRVPGSALFRVRVGYFESASVGDDERRRISALGFDAVVSTDGNEETRDP
ncbi:MAG: SPOR domain-containing protein [Gemmatimonadota bacterium]